MTKTDEFISEPIAPAGQFDASRMAQGEPGLPTAFTWREDELRVVRVLEAWKESGNCTHGSRERYLRKHWYRVLMDDGSEWVVYFVRQSRYTTKPTLRWWLYTKSAQRAAD